MSPSAARILLVEDEALNRALARATLARASDPRLRGATLVEATDLAVAAQLLDTDSFDLLILDHQLPDGSGLTLLGGLPDPKPKVLMVTAHVLPQVREAALAAGCDAFVGKPYRPADLLSALVALLDFSQEGAPDGGGRQ